MNGLEVQDKMNANGSLHTRVLRVVLRSKLPDLCSPLSKIVFDGFDKEFSAAAKHEKDWIQLPSFTMAKRVIAAANALVFFGSDLAANPYFLKAALAYPEDMFFTAEVLRLAPAIVHPLLAPLLMRNYQASKTMVKYLTPVVEQRLRRVRDSCTSEDQHPKPNDCIQFFVDANSRKGEWTAEKIVQVLLGTWFAAVHQPALTIVYALEDLCNHGEYVEPLRRELSALSQLREDEGMKSSAAVFLEDAPLLDAFLKESSRLHPSDSISVRRKVLEPFTFGDGTHLLPGDVACVPSQAIMRDEDTYSDSMKFSAWRFIRKGSGGQGQQEMRNTSRFTDAELTYPLWGLGRHSWLVAICHDEGIIH